MAKITEEEFLAKCLELLDDLDVDYKGDVIYLTDGGCSCIMNPKSKYYELFGGFSINSVAQYVAGKLNKKAIYKMDEFEGPYDKDDDEI